MRRSASVWRGHLIVGSLSPVVIVLVAMAGVRVTMRMRVSCPVLMDVFMFVKDNFQASPEGVGDPAQSREARHMIASLKAGDHRLGHPHALGELLLCLAGMFAQFKKPARAPRCDVVET